jgi:apolipoprotein N-acyltransferase
MRLNYLLSALSGVLYIVACAPLDQYYLMWFAFIPLFVALERIPRGQRTNWNYFKLSLTTGFFMGATGYYWLVHATQNYGGVPYAVGVLLWVVFCLTNQLQIPAYILLRKKIRTSPSARKHATLAVLVLAVCYVGLDTFIPKLFLDTIGSAFYQSPWVRQLADLGGPMAITFFGIAINELVFESLYFKRLMSLWIPAMMGVLICLYGNYRMTEFNELKLAHASDPVFRASLIQGNIGDFMKVAAERGENSAITQVMGQYVSLSQNAVKADPKPDAVIWPETAYPAIYERPFSREEARLDQMLKGLIREMPGYLIFGGYDNDSHGLEYNSIFFIKNKLPPEKQVYHKSMLLMFGETLPFADEFPSLKSLFPTMGFFGRGPGAEVKTVQNAAGVSFKLAPSICYEGLFVDFSIDGALLGADALINVTNDSWFGPHGEPYQHLSLTRFRSIETRVPMIRSTNTGFTVWIDPSGEQIKETKLGESAILEAAISKRYYPDSPYMAVSRIFGSNWFARLFQILTLAVMGYLFWPASRTAKKLG